MKHGCGGLLLLENCINPDADYPWLKEVRSAKAPLIFLAQRGWGASKFPGCHGGPGGIQNPGETPAEAAKREIDEEVGIEFFPDSPAYYEGSWEDRLLSYFLGKWRAPEKIVLRLSPEGIAESIGYGWLTFPQALKLDLSFLYREAIEKLALGHH